MASNSLIAVVGGSGSLGELVSRRLAALGVPQRDSADGLLGVETLFLASPDLDVVDAAVDAGVDRIVYSSVIGAAPDAVFTFARDHHEVEEHIRATGVAYTFLRENIHLDIVPMFATEDGVIAAPAGDGRAAWVAREDVADVAAAVLTQGGHDGQTYEVTGRESTTLAYAAEVLSDYSGRDVTYESVTVHEAYESRADYDAEDWEVDGWVTSYEAVAGGEMDIVTDVVPALTGHDAQTLREYLADNPESYAHLL